MIGASIDGDGDVISEEDAARLYRISVVTLRRRARDGKVPSFKIGWLRRYRRSSIVADIAEKERQEHARVSSAKRAALGMTVVR